MNRDEILKMQEGRDIDALIFEHVFGFEKGTFPVHAPMKSKLGDYMVRPIQEYSIDLSAAFEVVEKLEEHEHEILFSSSRKGTTHTALKWSVRFRECLGRQKESYAEAETLSLAICKAALLILVSND